MNTLVHADIFFFISSIGFVIIFSLLVVALVYGIRLLRRVDHISKKIEASIDIAADDTKALIADLRDSVAFRFLFGKRRRVPREKKE